MHPSIRQGRKSDAEELLPLVRSVAKQQEGLREELKRWGEDLGRRIDGLLEEIRAAEMTLAAADLRELNARQARGGDVSLQADLRALREKGIIDEHGLRTRSELPAAMQAGTAGVV